MRITRPINELFIHDGIVIKVKEKHSQYDCVNCVMRSESGCMRNSKDFEYFGYCHPSYRNDSTPIKFVAMSKIDA